MSDGDDGADPGDGAPSERPTAPDRAAEPDPEADLPDPESELPNVPSPPSVDVPSPPSVDVPTPSTAETDAPGELVAGFWGTVVVFNVAVLATSVGLLILVFGPDRRLGAGALVVGLFAAVHGYVKYRSLADRQRSGEWSDGRGDDRLDDGPSDDEPPTPEREDPGERNG